MKRLLRAIFLTSPLPADSLFLEAEAFKNRGGWSTDSQFILNMGSAYLMAHGLGAPVADASTEVTFPSTGTYHLQVRTKDWVAKWNAPGGPIEITSQKNTLTQVFSKGRQFPTHGGIVRPPR